jgi:hypothetical protein
MKKERFTKIVDGVEYQVSISIKGSKGTFKYDGYKITNEIEQKPDGIHLTENSVWVESGEGKFTINGTSVEGLFNNSILKKLNPHCLKV